MKKEYRTTVRARVARHVVLTLLISTIIVTVINLIYMSRRITQGQSNELSITTDLCASKVDTWANQLRGITIDIADTFEARGELKESDVKAVLNQIAETQSDLIFVYLATEDGKMYMARGVHFARGVNPCDRVWYKQAKETGKTVFIDPYISATRPDIMLSTAATPIYIDGKIAGVVGVDADVSLINEYINSMDFGNHSYGFLLDSENRVVAHKNPEFQPTINEVKYATDVMPELEEILNSKDGEGLVNGKDYNNDPVIYSVSKLDNNDWKIGVVYSQAQLYKSIDRGIRISLFIAAVCMFFAAAYMTTSIARILRPIDKINPAIARILQGDFSTSLNISNKEDELGELQDNLSEMIKQLSTMIAQQKKMIMEMEKGNLTVDDIPELPGDLKEVSIALNSIKETFNDIISDIQFSAINLQSFAMGINETSDIEQMRMVFEELSAEANILMDKTSRFITVPPSSKTKDFEDEEQFVMDYSEDE
ncbi:cache domain-containing sensor histidine kinase [Pseudobutyrivibrio sp.]|uniref:cache domain-containing sensor histidine kinase n=1 Tax=Pseudobutyrivibrio sp. TaxID=2014367 RepID=UPI0025CFFF22|nr:cache domain-containing protein [Pseudobutyrivibrio sp.]MBR5648452.1 HAMP domain-containing protein [Pseudobutyrivibrio sp.]